MQCSVCNLEMIQGTRPFRDLLIQELWFCPKCKLEILDKVVAGSIEVEALYSVEIEFGNQGASLRDLFKLRKIFLGSITEMKQKLLGQSQLSFGKYTKFQVDEICTQAISLGWSVKAIPCTNDRDQQYFLLRQ